MGTSISKVTYYQARDCELRPRGPRANGPTIIFGASSAGPRMLDLTARYADGWNTWFSSTGNTVEGLLPLLEKVDAACEAAGRDPATLERSAAVIVEVGPHEPSAMTGPPLTGSPAEIAAGLRAYADAGSPTSRSGWSRTRPPVSRHLLRCWRS